MDLTLKTESKKSAKCVASTPQCQLWPAVVFLVIDLMFSHFALCARHTYTHTHTNTQPLNFREIKKLSLARSVFNLAFMLKSLGEFIKNNSISSLHPTPIKLCEDWTSIFFWNSSCDFDVPPWLRTSGLEKEFFSWCFYPKGLMCWVSTMCWRLVDISVCFFS